MLYLPNAMHLVKVEIKEIKDKNKNEKIIIKIKEMQSIVVN